MKHEKISVQTITKQETLKKKKKKNVGLTDISGSGPQALLLLNL